MTRFDVHTTSDIPASPGADLGSKRDDGSEGDWPVRKAVGSRLWLSTMTRPDITNAVRAVARYAHIPTERPWQVITKILPCLSLNQKLRDHLCSGIRPGARRVCGGRLRQG